MVTIYDLLEVSENASKDEIKEAYSKMAIKYAINPSASEKENKENEFILNKLKVAYEILMNDEKRKKYDQMLSQKKAEDLIKNVTVRNDEPEEPQPNITDYNVQEEKQKEYDEKFDDTYEDEDEFDDTDEDVELTANEQKKIRNAATEEFRRNLKKAKKVEEEYKNAYKKVYNDYMRKNSKSSLNTLLRKIKNIFILIVAIIITCIILWNIPPIKNSLLDLYYGNNIIKAIVDIILSFFK